MTAGAAPSYAVTISGPTDVLESVRQALGGLGIGVTEVTIVDSGGDALDAPFGARKFIAAAGIITALLDAGTAGLKLAETIQAPLHGQPAVTLTISDAQTHARIVSVDHNTPTTVLLGALKSAQH
jgi:hypothetical protein